MNCCKHWRRAQEEGTDNEGYGSLIYDMSHDRERPVEEKYIGCSVSSDLPPVRFCPWCGDEKS